MTVFWICSALAVTAAAFAAFVRDLRRAVLALWIASLAVGGVYLSLNAELLAVVQWIASTLVAPRARVAPMPRPLHDAAKL